MSFGVDSPEVLLQAGNLGTVVVGKRSAALPVIVSFKPIYILSTAERKGQTEVSSDAPCCTSGGRSAAAVGLQEQDELPW